MKSFVLLLGILGHLLQAEATCPTGWESYNSRCWWVSTDALTWPEAESFCEMQGGYLASYTTADERDYVYRNFLRPLESTGFRSEIWIGANDLTNNGQWQWTDPQVTFDPAIPNWRSGQPDNIGTEDCVGVYVGQPALAGQSINGQWNDDSCDVQNRYLCSRAEGTILPCPDGWEQNGDNCYRLENSKQQWNGAEAACRGQGGHLVSIKSSDDQKFLTDMLNKAGAPNLVWTGLTDYNSPGTLTWINPAYTVSYSNWATGQPSNPLPYQGSSCGGMSQALGYAWSVERCSEERVFICQRGKSDRCPSGWTLLGEKCYEIFINPSRTQTWTTANEECRLQGAQLLKIENENEQKLIAAAMESYANNGNVYLWLGGSDIGHDDMMSWADGSPIATTFWDTNEPRYVTGRDDCMGLYASKTENNWITSSCFYERPFFCELPEGQPLPAAPVITVEGKCTDGFMHFKGYCYMVRDEEKTQADAQAFCQQNGAQLASINNADEESFISGISSADVWIGLKKMGGSYQWVDGSSVSFTNWKSDATKSQDCVHLLYSGAWMDDSCNNAKAFVCKRTEIKTQETTVPTPTGDPATIEKCGSDGWISDTGSDQCYKMNAGITRNWFDARAECQAEGGDLVSINSPDEQAFIEKTLPLYPTVVNVWIGAYDFESATGVDAQENVASGWEWSDGTPYNYIHTDIGEPNNMGNEDCMELYVGNGMWNDNDCYIYLHFMCEKKGKVNAIIGPDVTDDDCKSSDSCCFTHLGVEFGGYLNDSVMSASSQKSDSYRPARGRLNTPADVVVIDGHPIGTGHGCWEPASNDLVAPYLQVDFPAEMEVKGIITQGRNGINQYTERQWTTKFTISYSQDPDHLAADVVDWEFLTDSEGNKVEFDGNSDQNTQVTNIFPRALVVRHIRCNPIDWKEKDENEKPALRLEYIGCKASCVHPLGMSTGLITDSMITASSQQSGREAKQARAPVKADECLVNANDKGESYRGWISKTQGGLDCQRWSEQTPHSHSETADKFPDADLRGNRCRNPQGKRNQPWCYTTDPNVEWDYCTIPICPGYQPSGWTPSTSNDQQYVQVAFQDFFKIAGVTLYGSGSNYVSKYALWFSDDGTNFRIYQSQTGQDYLFNGLDGAGNYFFDILREPISTKFVRIQPRQWTGSQITMQFEINGCYVDRRLSCSETSTAFSDSSTFSIDCPAGCVEDQNKGQVYGTGTYTDQSAVCPAAVHAGRVNNNHGGSVQVNMLPGANSYTGTYANGITSLDYGTAKASYAFDGKIYRCEDEWTAFRDHCYWMPPSGVLATWQDARASCIDKGGDLVSILDIGENDFLEALINQADKGGDIWIGMNDLDTQNYYLWSDGSTVTITNWNGQEPNAGHERCVQIYRFQGRWNDKPCETELSYICKKGKQMLDPPKGDTNPADVGCQQGWTAYGSSCYKVPNDIYMFIYAERVCNEMDSHLATIQDDVEQAFVHALVTSTLPPALGYTAWIGLSAKTDSTGGLYWEWENGEQVSYTHWGPDQPNVRFQCAFPFTYKGKTYYECADEGHPAGRVVPPDQKWCSIDPVYNGRWINCGKGEEFGCTYMDDQTGLWTIEVCGANRYYVCEMNRVGYTQVATTTPSTAGVCANGWSGDSTTSYCYQINEYADAENVNRLSWEDALDYCRAQGADLVSVLSDKEYNDIVTFVTNKQIFSYTYFWMGLNNLGIDTGYVWTDGSPVTYTPWAAGEPNNYGNAENCAEASFYDTTSGWNDINCDAKRNFICKIVKSKTPSDPPALPPPKGTVNDPMCGDGWIRFQAAGGQDKCWKFVTDKVAGWDTANTECITYGGNLASAHSDDENDFLFTRAYEATASGHGSVWLGLRDQGGRAFFWADGTTVDYVNWASGEPNNFYDSEGCTEMTTANGYWNDDNCGVKKYYICERLVNSQPTVIPPTVAAPGNCEPGYTAFGNNCYMKSEDMVTWDDANTACKAVGAQLVSLTNAYEQDFLTYFLHIGTTAVWTGLTDRGQNSWIWTDQTDFVYSNWAPGMPNGYFANGCAESRINEDDNGAWFENDCGILNQYVCYKPLSTANEPQPPPSTELDCPSDYIADEFHMTCVKLMDGAVGWNDAQAACRAEGDGIDIMSVGEVYDNDLLHSWFYHDIPTGGKLWLGMTFTSVAATSEVDFMWSNNYPVFYTNWAPSNPSHDAVSTGSGCVYMDNDGMWYTVPTNGATSCSSTFNFACIKHLNPIPTTPAPTYEGTCDPGFEAAGPYCYYVEYGLSDETTRSFYEAQAMCEARGSKLASFHSYNETQNVFSLIAGQPSHNLFIGLYSDGFGGWDWTDGTGADYFNWAPNEPNGVDNGELCVEFYPWDGTWNDIDCFTRRGYICRHERDVTTCDIGLPGRVDCGFDGITEHNCVLTRGCCFDPTYISANNSGCYYGEGVIIGPSGKPNKPDEKPAGLSSAGAAAIAIIVILVVIIIGGFAYFKMTGSTPKMPSTPSFSTPSFMSSSKSKTQTTVDVSSGFDNPMSYDNTA